MKSNDIPENLFDNIWTDDLIEKLSDVVVKANPDEVPILDISAINMIINSLGSRIIEKVNEKRGRK